MAQPIRIAFLGCGFITAVHSRHVRALGAEAVLAYASRDRAKADEYCRRFGGVQGYGDYAAAIEDPAVDAVVVAVPPALHLDLTLRALDRRASTSSSRSRRFRLLPTTRRRLTPARARSASSSSAKTITTSRWR